MHSRKKFRVALLKGFVLAFSLGVLQADGASQTPAFSQDRAAVESRLENVRRLVGTSSGARRVESSSDTQAKALRANAQAALEAAEGELAGGDMAAANSRLQEATEAMFEAIRRVGTGSDGEQKRQRDFEAKARSVDVLLAATERVAGEKGGSQAVLAKVAQIRARATEAGQLAAAGRAVEGRALLDRAYDEAKLELERLRHGDTLVRTLSFADKEEEYHYELDRNDTHKMLLKVLLEDQVKDAGMRQRVDGLVAESEQLRARAEREAGSGAFAKAVQSLEAATKALQRAIRSAGVYIPG